MIVIIGITGASGAIYGVRMVEALSKIKGIETHLIISENGEKIIRHETKYQPDDLRKMADYSYGIDDIGATISSGSFLRDAMVVAPCSIKTMSALANSYTENLLIRAGDVTLKERKPLVLLVRETPFHAGHLENMLRLSRMGATILPPIPSFYHKPKTINDLIDHTIARALDLMGIKHNLSQRWHGMRQ
ncbi:MAG: UbiX family flavin prenyltransferase [Chloroflexota bacterium]